MHQLDTQLTPQVQSYLTQLSLNPPPTLLFEGTKNGSQKTFAKTFANTLLSDASPHKLESGNHPDLRELYPEGKTFMHPIQTIKNLIHEVIVPPFESKRKVYIIHEADRMLPSSSHALLKTLEEPPSYAHFILITSHVEALLPTIISRSLRVPLFFSTQQKAMLEKDNQLLKLIVEIGTAALHQNYPNLFDSLKILETLTDTNQTEAIEQTLEALYNWYRDIYLLKVGGDSSLLFFKDHQEEIKKNLDCPLPDLVELQKRCKRIQEALTCNISLRNCLLHLMI